MPNPRFESALEAHHDEIYHYLWRLARSSPHPEPGALAEDLTQETFVQAFQAYQRLRPDSNVRAWLFKIATNCARSAFRAQRRRRDWVEQAKNERPTSPSNTLEEGAVEREWAARLRSAVGALPVKQQAAVTLRHLHELPYEDIATALRCSTESARANVYQGLRRLREMLSVEEERR